MGIKKVILSRSAKYPDWFTKECKLGKIKMNYDEDGELLNATVHTPVKIQTANIGDAIVKLRSGVHVIVADRVKKNGKNVDK